MILLRLAISLSSLPTTAGADWWDDIANNLATDLTPFISLLGEAPTKQFLSESTRRIDYFIFAMAPLGILTALVSVIRVRGGPSLRAFIGRSQEGIGAIEAELCSSTSRDVCELYNNGGIARVFGRPKILEIVYDSKATMEDFWDSKDTKATAGLYSFQDYFQKLKGEAEKQKKERKQEEAAKELAADGKQWENVVPLEWREVSDFPSLGFARVYGRLKRYTWEASGRKKTLTRKDTESGHPQRGADATPPQPDQFAPNPNITLNIGIRPKSKGFIYIFAFLAFIVQGAALVFGALATYYFAWRRDGQHTPRYAFPLFASGTGILCTGMFFCAFLVGESTKERCFERDLPPSSSRRSRFFWLQPGGQVIADQHFDPFAYTDSQQPLEEYITSWKLPTERYSPLPALATVFMIAIGFILQFIGLRALHSSVSVFQLGVIILMSIIRSSMRMQRLDAHQNLLLNQDLQQILGHELDWLALYLANHGDKDKDDSAPAFWYFQRGLGRGKIVLTPTVFDRHGDGTGISGHSTARTGERLWICGSLVSPQMFVNEDVAHKENKVTEAVKVLAWRKRLGTFASKDSTRLGGNSRRLPRLHSSSWWEENIPARQVSLNLGKAMTETAALLFSKSGSTILLPGWKDSLCFYWATSIRTATEKYQFTTAPELFYLGISRQSTLLNEWTIDTATLEAILSLWVRSMLRESELAQKKSRPSRSSEPRDVEIYKIFDGDTLPSDEGVDEGPPLLPLWAHLRHGQDGGAFTYIKGDRHNTGDLHCQYTVKESGSSATEFVGTTTCLWSLHKGRFFRRPEEYWCPALSRNEFGTQEETMRQYFGWHTLNASAVTMLDPACMHHCQIFSPPYMCGNGFTAIPSEANLFLLCAQELYASFLEAACAIVTSFGDEAIAETAASGDAIALRHPILDDLSKIFTTNHLGSQLDAVITILPVIRFKICGRQMVFNAIRREIDSLMVGGNWRGAEDLVWSALDVAAPCLNLETFFGFVRILEEVYLKAKWAGVTLARPKAEHHVNQGAGDDSDLEQELGALEFEQMDRILSFGSKWHFAEYCRAVSHRLRALLDPTNTNTASHLQAYDRAFHGNGSAPIALKISPRQKFLDAWKDGDHALRKVNMAFAALKFSFQGRLLRHQLESVLRQVDPDEAMRNLDFEEESSRRWLQVVVEHNAKARGHDALDLNSLPPSIRPEAPSVFPDDWLDTFLIWIKRGLNPNTEIDSDTFLGHASQHGVLQVVEALMKAGADVNKRNSNGMCPLQIAAEGGYDAIVRRFIGMQDLIIDEYHYLKSPLWLAASGGHQRVVDMLVASNRFPSVSLLWMAIVVGNTQVAKSLLSTEAVPSTFPFEEDVVSSVPLWRSAHEDLSSTKAQRKQWTTSFRETSSYEFTTSIAPFLLAAVHDRQEIVEFIFSLYLPIITPPVDVEIRSKLSGNRALHICAANGYDGLVQTLLAQGAKPEARNGQGRTPICLAAQHGNDACLRILLSPSAYILNMTDNGGRTALSLSAESGSCDVVQTLLDTGRFQLDLCDNEKRTPLSYASEKGHDGIVDLFLRGSAKPDEKDQYGRTPLSYASENGHDSCAQLLIGTGEVDLNSRDNRGRNPLSYAFSSGNESLVHRFLSFKTVNVREPDNMGRTPFFWAVAIGHDRVFRHLLSIDSIDADEADADGTSPLCCAAFLGRLSMAEALLHQKKADPNRDCSYDGFPNQTPLMLAAKNGHHEIVQLLLLNTDGRLNIEKTDRKGRNAVHWAAIGSDKSGGHVRVLKQLLDAGSDPNKYAIYRGTPLQCAITAYRRTTDREAQREVIRTLLGDNRVEVAEDDKLALTKIMGCGKQDAKEDDIEEEWVDESDSERN